MSPINRSCTAAPPDDLEHLLQPADRLGAAQPVGLEVLPFPGPDPQDRAALREVSQGQHRLGNEHRMAANEEMATTWQAVMVLCPSLAPL
jgi:hypothetical protein